MMVLGRTKDTKLLKLWDDLNNSASFVGSKRGSFRSRQEDPLGFSFAPPPEYLQNILYKCAYNDP